MKRLFRSLSLIALMGMLTLSSCVSHKKLLLLKDMQMMNRYILA